MRVPWRCLLPRGLDGVIVTGLGVSAHRDALPCIRMQADIQNQGYAAGVAAAWIAKKGCATRALDIKELQKHLVAVGNLPESILRETDNFPLPKERVAEAVRRVVNDYDGLEIVLAQFDIAQPLLRQALAAAPENGPAHLCAHPGHDGRRGGRSSSGRCRQRQAMGRGLALHRHGAVWTVHEPARQPPHRAGPHPIAGRR